jgi:hypothetical protein
VVEYDGYRIEESTMAGIPYQPNLSTTLLLRINQGLAQEEQERYQALIDRRDARTLTPQEHEELLRLSDRVEQTEADRAAALVELAQLRKVPVDELLRELGIRPLSHG